MLTDGYPPELPGTLVAGAVAHLTAAASEAIGVVGPLVIPGRTACLSCVDLARSDRDPAWPLILAQTSGRASQPAACTAVLAAAVAAQATAQALAYLDQAASGGVVINGTLELVLPDWQWRRRSWAPHPHCRCSRRTGILTENGRVNDLPRRAVTRTAKLATLPAGLAGRTALGLGKRLGGRPPRSSPRRSSSAPPSRSSGSWGNSRAAR